MKQILLTKALTFVSLASALALPCGISQAATKVNHSHPKAVKKQTQAAAKQQGPEIYSKTLTPLESGPGIVICEPVLDQNVPFFPDFSIACSRWLQFYVGGQPQFGKSPLWGDLIRIRQELAKSDLRLNVNEIDNVAPIVGVNYVATARITGKLQDTTLTYQLWSVPNHVAVGDPLTLTGNFRQIMDGLPGLATKLCSQMGLTDTNLPATMDISFSDFIELGRVPTETDDPLHNYDNKSLIAAAASYPMAGLLLLESGSLTDPDQRASTTLTLLSQAAGNPIITGEIALHGGKQILQYQDQISSQAQKYPGSYLLNLTECAIQEMNHNIPGQHDFAEKAVRGSIRNPEAWLLLGRSIGDQAQNLRQGRTADKISDAEWAVITPEYSQWLDCEVKAVSIDPLFGRGWFRVAEAATFTGDDSGAQMAFWNAVKLDRSELPNVYFWGLEMFQDKWLDRPDDLKKVGQLAVDAHYNSPMDAIRVAQELSKSGQNDFSDKLLDKIIVEQKDAEVKDQLNANPHFFLAYAFHLKHNDADALNELQRYQEIKPNGQAGRLLLKKIQPE